MSNAISLKACRITIYILFGVVVPLRLLFFPLSRCTFVDFIKSLARKKKKIINSFPVVMCLAVCVDGEYV